MGVEKFFPQRLDVHKNLFKTINPTFRFLCHQYLIYFLRVTMLIINLNKYRYNQGLKDIFQTIFRMFLRKSCDKNKYF